MNSYSSGMSNIIPFYSGKDFKKNSKAKAKSILNIFFKAINPALSAGEKDPILISEIKALTSKSAFSLPTEGLITDFSVYVSTRSLQFQNNYMYLQIYSSKISDSCFMPLEGTQIQFRFSKSGPSGLTYYKNLTGLSIPVRAKEKILVVVFVESYLTSSLFDITGSIKVNPLVK